MFQYPATVLMLLQVALVTGYSPEGEMTLRSKLLAASVYDHVTRPNVTTHVTVALSILTVNHLNVKTQEFSTSGWLILKWTDPRLKWTPSNHENIKYIYALESEIWRPEIIVDNSMSSLEVFNAQNLLLRIKHTGEVTWEPPAIFDTHCDVDVTYYPFDRQKCVIELTSWSTPLPDLALFHTRNEIILEDYRENGEWILIGSETETSQIVEHLDGGVQYYSQLDFYVIVKRRPVFYVINTILPIILMSFLTVIVFLLPAESGEKVSYALTVILALAVLLTLISDHLPSTSLSVAVIAVYIEMTLFIGGVSVLLSVLILRTYHRHPDVKPTACTIKLTAFVSRLFCMKTSTPTRRIDGSRTKRFHDNMNSTESQKRMTKIVPAYLADDSVCGEIDENHDENYDEERRCRRQFTWREISVIWDRFCFLLFMFFNCLSTAIFMLAVATGGHFQGAGH